MSYRSKFGSAYNPQIAMAANDSALAHLSPEALTAVLRQNLPKEYWQEASEIAHLLVAALQRELAHGEGGALEFSGKTVAALEKLSGKRVTSNKTVVSFGADNQFGDVTIRDVANRDIVTLNFYIQTDSQSKTTPSMEATGKIKKYGILGIPIFSVTEVVVRITIIFLLALVGIILSALGWVAYTGALPDFSQPTTVPNSQIDSDHSIIKTNVDASEFKDLYGGVCDNCNVYVEVESEGQFAVRLVKSDGTEEIFEESRLVQAPLGVMKVYVVPPEAIRFPKEQQHFAIDIEREGFYHLSVGLLP